MTWCVVTFFFIMFRSKDINKMTRVLSANVTLNRGGQLGIVLVFCHCKKFNLDYMSYQLSDIVSVYHV